MPALAELVGDLVLGYESFTATDDPDQILGIYTVEPGSPSADRLALLAGWSSPPYQPDHSQAAGAAKAEPPNDRAGRNSSS
ncbi:hypothetical protein JK364_10855 [Streptomyces sp. 110]|uniref:MmyB-like transcription regulator ligand binding domain-containing protein n=1 Tax=Streptomyces endocoffeicus TaxID=2898945 RepID=A0ABS1PKG6_9ACTN|nr:hypothetical protein [Streptomyces endocoffeicus]MBL1112887.1 hypothetical protein [Streptomyces endocoffeicus]